MLHYGSQVNCKSTFPEAAVNVFIWMMPNIPAAIQNWHVFVPLLYTRVRHAFIESKSNCTLREQLIFFLSEENHKYQHLISWTVQIGCLQGHSRCNAMQRDAIYCKCWYLLCKHRTEIVHQYHHHQRHHHHVHHTVFNGLHSISMLLSLSSTSTGITHANAHFIFDSDYYYFDYFWIFSAWKENGGKRKRIE